ncbi:MAG: choline kinase [Hyphomicrobiales bacterium]|nr:phosphotransferase [Hyphomicrobiales bacterium]PCJ92229.1 MAG: choline kinase [Hyphomicrobiales bacterium]
MSDFLAKLQALPIWHGAISVNELSGGLTNKNYLVRDDKRTCVVRMGDDIPEHQIMRFNELAASRAAYDAGISPQVLHAQPGILVLAFIKGKTLGAKDVRAPGMLERILPVLKTCHHTIPEHFRGATLMFWVFQVLRDYAATLRARDSAHISKLPELMQAASLLEKAASPIDIVFGHNDLLPANFIDDGVKIWLIDWDYAGFNSPLFDLGGLASNNELSDIQELWLLENYFENPANDLLLRQYNAMKCASLLREAMWSMVSEIHSDIEFDYPAYTRENLSNFKAAYEQFLQS